MVPLGSPGAKNGGVVPQGGTGDPGDFFCKYCDVLLFHWVLDLSTLAIGQWDLS